MEILKNWLKKEECGQGVVEYALVIAGIALVLITVVLLLGQQIADFFTGFGEKLSNPHG